MKILSCREIFNKNNFIDKCYSCSELENEKYCYGIFYYFKLLFHLPGKIIKKIKINMKFYFRKTDDLPF